LAVNVLAAFESIVHSIASSPRHCRIYFLITPSRFNAMKWPTFIQEPSTLTAPAFVLSDAALKQVTSTSKVEVIECGCKIFINIAQILLR